MGVLVPEALTAADRLEQAGVGTDVVCVTSPGLLFQAIRSRQGGDGRPVWILDQVITG
ncbi:hypothetical protein GCM10009527_020730 [Actinomadura nitritigenes]|uniref:Uncharacterized protein n=1 Tax=Actinomadura nitritigenes TaxID=134602 RepID=A0ABS3QVP7_9ACTN|nr:hypothetical protein [Actinomadura nitritigenes]MBO2438057.1 hypothetical protein [Actinomadura nitritigenes]